MIFSSAAETGEKVTLNKDSKLASDVNSEMLNF